MRQLALLSMIRELADTKDCQFIIATHSPILQACPGAVILNCDQHPLQPTTFDELESISLLKDFLACPERMLRHL